MKNIKSNWLRQLIRERGHIILIGWFIAWVGYGFVALTYPLSADGDYDMGLLVYKLCSEIWKGTNLIAWIIYLRIYLSEI